MINFYTKIEEALYAKEFIKKYSVILELNKLYKIQNEFNKNLISLTPISVKSSVTCGRPELPKLVNPSKLSKRGIGTLNGKASLIHSIAHIEFNAINLALDAIYRFSNMPDKYYIDWLQIALEECEHFLLLNGYLEQIGFRYGSFDAHNGLWEMAEKTGHDPLVRMALVPRVLEARGLDVTPSIINKFRSIRDYDMVGILEIIQHDEIGHVKVGSHWYKFLCKKRGLDHISTFKKLIQDYAPDILQPPFNIKHREIAGFCQNELSLLYN